MIYFSAHQITDRNIKKLQEKVNKNKRDESYQVNDIESYHQLTNLKRILKKAGIEARHSKYQNNKKLFKASNLIKTQLGRIPNITSYRLKFVIKQQKEKES